MSRGCFLFIVLTFGALLLLLSDIAQAYFIIEFIDGTRITVSNYKEVGQTVKVYTQEGWFAFRKDDVARIIDTNPRRGTRSPGIPAETKLTSPADIKKRAEHQQQSAFTPQQAPGPEQARQKKDHVQEIQTQPTLTLLKEALSQFLTVPDVYELFHRVKGGLFQLRYIFALLLGIKVLKIFFTVGIR